jgi:hypothetical protein
LGILYLSVYHRKLVPSDYGNSSSKKWGSLNSDGFFSHGVRLSPLGTVAIVWPIVPAPNDDDDDCGAVVGM